MNENEYLGSNFVTKNAVIVFFVLAAASIYLGYTNCAILLIFLGIISLLSKYWGKMALKDVDIKIEGSHQRIFKGETIPVKYIISNKKSLPLIWIELMHDIPQRECAVPLDGFTKKTIKNKETLETKEEYSVKFTWILPYQTLKWKTKYKAVKRGLYTLDHLKLFGGDGFGLSIEEKDFLFKTKTGFIVYPEIFNVDEGIFKKSLSQNSGSNNGIYEDTTLLKNIKDYDGRDSFKKINWRLAAKGGDLSVNIYQTITPSSCFFILDTASFNEEENDEYFEKAISFIASAVVLLEGKISCGAAIPKTALNDSFLILPEESQNQTDDILTALSSAEADFSSTPYFDKEKLISSSDSMGQVFICSLSHEKTTLYDMAYGLKCPNIKYVFSKTSHEEDSNFYYIDNLVIGESRN